nr:MAG TPA: hypothetical protein [Caudoviricetes sp.]
MRDKHAGKRHYIMRKSMAALYQDGQRRKPMPARKEVGWYGTPLQGR